MYSNYDDYFKSVYNSSQENAPISLIINQLNTNKYPTKDNINVLFKNKCVKPKSFVFKSFEIDSNIYETIYSKEANRMIATSMLTNENVNFQKIEVILKCLRKLKEIEYFFKKNRQIVASSYYFYNRFNK